LPSSNLFSVLSPSFLTIPKPSQCTYCNYRKNIRRFKLTIIFFIHFYSPVGSRFHPFTGQEGP
jgi:hypothetical protein